MKRLDRPNLNEIDVLSTCVAGIANADLAQKFNDSKNAIEAVLVHYNNRAVTNELYRFEAASHGNPTQVVLEDLTKGELVSLYSDHMAKRDASGYGHYNTLMTLAPLGICPYCGFGHTYTLDHFLSKSRYPLFSVHPNNLIPACRDCNTGKGASALSEFDLMLHPYFEDPIIDATTWLVAEMVQSSPVVVTYSVKPPLVWSGALIQRIYNYFEDLDLQARFSTQAAVELGTIGAVLRTTPSVGARQSLLKTFATVERGIARNSWKAALYDCLARSDWYIHTGCLT